MLEFDMVDETGPKWAIDLMKLKGLIHERQIDIETVIMALDTIFQPNTEFVLCSGKEGGHLIVRHIPAREELLKMCEQVT
jgi:hypothetical protein